MRFLRKFSLGRGGWRNDSGRATTAVAEPDGVGGLAAYNPTQGLKALAPPER